MNKTLLAVAILTSFLIPATSTKAQISTVEEDGTTWIIVDGSDLDDSVYVVESYGRTEIYLHNANGNLVDSWRLPGIFQFPSAAGGGPSTGGSSFSHSLSGETQKPEFIIVANLGGGDDYYCNNSHLFALDIVDCGTGSDTVYAGPSESWVGCDRRDQGRKGIFGGSGDDWLVGGAGHDYISGGDGDDTIRGNDGNDLIRGGAGDDNLKGGRGSDQIDGGTGRNTIK